MSRLQKRCCPTEGLTAPMMVAVFFAFSLGASGVAWGEEAASVAERFPPESITSVESANAALAAVEDERRRIAARFGEAERACRNNFFVTQCIDKAREARRQAAAPLAAIELEAEKYKRLERVRQRDGALEERRKNDEAKKKAGQS